MGWLAIPTCGRRDARRETLLRILADMHQPGEVHAIVVHRVKPRTTRVPAARRALLRTTQEDMHLGHRDARRLQVA